jgi:hypothetical protein
VPIAGDAGSGPALFADTNQLGIYDVARTVNGRRQVLSHFAVDVSSPDVSAVAPVAHPNLASSIAAATPGTTRTRRQDWWPWLAGAALIVLSAEWAVFHRGL